MEDIKMKQYQKPSFEISNLIREDMLLDVSNFDSVIIDTIDWDTLFV